MLSCVVCFLVIAPVLVLYSTGDRFDFKKMKITATGGIYVRSYPQAEQIVIDSKIKEKPGLFSNSIFVQSLLPNLHSVLVKKTGYYDYSKIIPVQEKEVTKLENILLIKKSIAFSEIGGQTDYFSVAPDNQSIITAQYGSKSINFDYFSLTNINKQQTFSISGKGKVLEMDWSEDSTKSLIKIQNANAVIYELFNNAPLAQATPTSQTTTLVSASPTIAPKFSVTRLAYLDKNTQQILFNPQNSNQIFFVRNNSLYYSNVLENTRIVATTAPAGQNPILLIKNLVAYQFSGNNIVWLSPDGTVSQSDISGKLIEQSAKNKIVTNTQFLFNKNTKNFENISLTGGNYQLLVSPDSKNLIYWNSNNIYISSSENSQSQPNTKYQQLFSGANINFCQWLNNSYIVFTAGDKIIISEIDYRGNINSVTLPQTITISSTDKIEVKNPQIFFNTQNSKLYILANNSLLSSEKLIP